MSDKIKVVYILGEGRSGTTLLDRLLGQIEGFVSTGEVSLIWKWGFAENLLCGCGQPFRDCPFWAGVVERCIGSVDQIQVNRMLDLKASLLRTRHLHRLLLPRRRTQYGQELAAYGHVLGDLYQAIRDASGCRLIVDSSKNVLYGLVLNRLPNVDLHVVHLVRDSRAVAYSWQRKRVRPEVHNKDAFMDTFSPGSCARDWLIKNALIHILRPFYRHYTLLRYEDLVADPRGVLASLCTAVGEPAPPLAFLEHTNAYLEANHTVAGNPMRFSTGPVAIRQDVEWKKKMAKGSKLLVSALTLPLLLVYGYASPGGRVGLGGHGLPPQLPSKPPAGCMVGSPVGGPGS
jgi:hypothetical protein